MRTIAFLISFCTLVQIGFAQAPTDQLNNNKLPLEKIYIHFDRTIYSSGETIFYKAYITTATGITNQSKNLYVEWYTNNGKLIKQTVAPLSFSGAAGSFDIPADYKGESLQVMAYTRWMLNDHNKEFIYQQAIPLMKKDKETTVAVSAEPTVDIFPEGGYLVEGISSRVAFLARNNYGMPVQIHGKLRNSANEIVADIFTMHDGMGFFVIKPDPKVDYYLDWNDVFGHKGLQKIDAIQPTGATITVYTTSKDAHVTIQYKDATASTEKLYRLVAMQQGSVFATKQITVSNNAAQRITIPIVDAESGIMALTLFDANDKPVAERIIFIDHQDYIANTTLRITKQNLANRGMNSLVISNKEAALSNLSIAVYDATIALPQYANIISHLLLSTELKGLIYQPQFYFDTANKQRTEFLDLVMLTHGWRAYNWKSAESVARSLPPQYEAEQQLMRLYVEASPSFAGERLNLILIGKDSATKYIPVVFDANGKFERADILFTDTINAYFAFDKKIKNKADQSIKFSNGFLPSRSLDKFNQAAWIDYSVQSNTLQQTMSQQYARFEKYTNQGILKNVTVTTKVKTKMELMDEKYTNAVFRGGTPYTFDMVDDRLLGHRNIFNYLQGKVPGLLIQPGFPPDSLSSFGGSFTDPIPTVTFPRTGYQPLFLLDEMPVRIDVVATVPLIDIAYIKVFQPPFVGASLGGAGGAIAIYTRRGDERQPDFMPNRKGMEITKINGYSVFKEFFNPVYSKSYNPTQVDARKTLYWNPSIILDQRTKEKKIEFFNNDISKKLMIVIEGISADGKLTRIVKQMD